MPEWWNEPIRSPYLWLILGVISISAAAFFTYTGKVWVRFDGWVYCDEGDLNGSPQKEQTCESNTVLCGE
jgi:hypothetical protein